MTEWKPTKYTTKCCGDIIWSERPGRFKECKCGDSFVDETEYYCRLGGTEMPELYGDIDDSIRTQ